MINDFKGDNVCEGCPRRIDGVGPCAVYSVGGMDFRRKMGHCPIVNRWADWHINKPAQVERRVRVGQQKTKQSSNK